MPDNDERVSGHPMRTARRARSLVAAMVLVLLASLLGPAPVAAAQQNQPPAPPPTIRIEGGGWGHGVGMSQYGAYGRAAAGHTHREILAFYYPGSELVTRDVGRTGVRVHLSTARTITVESSGAVGIVTSDGTEIWTSTGATTLRVDRMSNGRMRVRTPNGTNRCRQDGADRCGRRPVTIRFRQGEPVKTTPSGVMDSFGTSGNRYRWGRLVFTPTPGTVDTVWSVLEGLDMQQYLYGLAEVPASWPEAALESQAIAGRTFAFANILKRRADPNRTVPWDLYSSVWDQYYSGFGHEVGISSDRWLAAVDRTADRVMTYQGSPFAAFYSSSNGGHTEDSGYVFLQSLPYLPAQPDPFDGYRNPYGTWVREYAGDDLGRWIATAGRGSVGTVRSVEIGGNVGASGRVDRATITVRGTSGTATMTGPQFMAAVNAGITASGGSREAQIISTRWRVGNAPPVVVDRVEPPSGAVDTLRRRNGRVVVSGWVTDPSGHRIGPATVRVTIGGRTRVVTEATRARFDIAEANGLADASGFRVVRRIGPRTRNVCVYVTSAVGGDEVMLGCRRV
jgi:peptidoglycan hydrolase-like amidase